MRIELAGGSVVVATPCADALDQARRLGGAGPGDVPLALSPLWAKSSARPGRCLALEILGTGDKAAAFVVEARRGRSLVVIHGPLSDPASFAEAIDGVATERGANQIHVEAVAPECAATPRLVGEESRIGATGLLIDLTGQRTNPPRNHRRNIQRARKRGAVLSTSKDPADLHSHLALCTESLTRLSDRGEEAGAPPDLEQLEAMLRSGFGALYRAELDGVLATSDLVIRIADRSFYVSGGTSPEGRDAGTAHLVMDWIIESELGAGSRTLNMGYPNAPGLTRFKEGFGAMPYFVERVTASRDARVWRWLRRLAATLRQQRAARGKGSASRRPEESG
jgi:hypothetical protein